MTPEQRTHIYRSYVALGASFHTRFSAQSHQVSNRTLETLCGLDAKDFPLFAEHGAMECQGCKVALETINAVRAGQ